MKLNWKEIFLFGTLLFLLLNCKDKREKNDEKISNAQETLEEENKDCIRFSEKQYKNLKSFLPIGKLRYDINDHFCPSSQLCVKKNQILKKGTEVLIVNYLPDLTTPLVQIWYEGNFYCIFFDEIEIKEKITVLEGFATGGELEVNDRYLLFGNGFYINITDHIPDLHSLESDVYIASYGKYKYGTNKMNFFGDISLLKNQPSQEPGQLISLKNPIWDAETLKHPVLVNFAKKNSKFWSFKNYPEMIYLQIDL
jgi:hypothetical protein